MLNIHFMSYIRRIYAKASNHRVNASDMDISILAVLIFLQLDDFLCDNYRNSSFYNGLPPSDLIIYTTGGPVPDYLLNSPYKIVPLPNNFARRADDPGAVVELSSKKSQNSTIVGGFARDASLRYRSQTSNRPIRKQRKQNRNRTGRRNLERYSQRVESTDVVNAVPLKTQPKGKEPSTTLERNVAIPNRSKKPAYTTDSNKLTSPSYQYRERNVADSNKQKRPVYINEDTSSSLYRERNIANSENSNKNVYVNDVSKPSTVPSFLLPSKNFPTSLAYSPLSTVYSASPSYIAPSLPTPTTKLNKFPRPVVKSSELAAYDFGPLYKPYSFGYDVFDGYGTKQYRQESATGDGVVRGNYGYRDFQGIYRQVEYIADENGFHAVLKSNEPGLSNVDTADVSVSVDPPPIWPPSENQVL